LYEGGIRSPLVVWGPGFIQADRAGDVNRESIFAAIDLVPTILAIAGVAGPTGQEFDGEPLADVLLGKSNASREQPIFFRRPPDRDAFYVFDNLPDLAVRAGRWKLLCEYDGTAVQLYDLEVDQQESTDVARQHPTIVQDLKGRLIAWHEAMPADNGPNLAGKQQGRKKSKE
jgi:uncharacterized sulfatase